MKITFPNYISVLISFLFSSWTIDEVEELRLKIFLIRQYTVPRILTCLLPWTWCLGKSLQCFLAIVFFFCFCFFQVEYGPDWWISRCGRLVRKFWFVDDSIPREELVCSKHVKRVTFQCNLSLELLGTQHFLKGNLCLSFQYILFFETFFQSKCLFLLNFHQNPLGDLFAKTYHSKIKSTWPSRGSWPPSDRSACIMRKASSNM